MQLLIPYAVDPAQACQSVFLGLDLPHLRALLARLQPQAPDAGDAFSLSAPHERAHARALGLPDTDGLIPWAAWHAWQMDAAPAAHAVDAAWGFLTPCHWHTGMDRMTMAGWPLPELSAAECRALLGDLQIFFQEDGISLQAATPGHWLAHGELLRNLPSASLERVLGQNLDHWMPRSAAAASWRRLQNETQMLLHTHPVNAARQGRGAAVINSLWLHGTGCLPAGFAPQPPPAVCVADNLRAPALAADWAAWGRAWQQIDSQHCARLLSHLEHARSACLTLCGQRQARSWRAPPQRAWWQRLALPRTAIPHLNLMQTL